MHSEDALRHWISLQGMPGYDPVSQGEQGPHSRTGKPRNQRPSDPSEMELHDLAADNPSQKMTKLFPGASLASSFQDFRCTPQPANFQRFAETSEWLSANPGRCLWHARAALFHKLTFK